ncbi:MAG: DegT/DnrJ/EryC1/StrS family aminotransferase [Desulfobacteraceae bacterium]
MKYYLDTSSVVKIYHPEEGSKESLELYRGGSALCISELSVLEFMSVVYGKLRENDIDSKTVDELVLKFREDIETRYELLAFSPLVFVDSEADTWNMDPDLLEGAIKALLRKGRRIKAIIPVHLYGMPAKMGEIMAIASRYDIPVIEDAAESLGSTYQGKGMGTFGRMGVLSFNGNKIITTSGGGALIGDDPDRIQKARFLAAQARDDAPHYQHSHVGYNYRMSNIVAGIGRGQMEVLPSRVERRREINQWYRNLLAHVPGITFQSEPAADFYSNFWLTAITIDPAQAGVDREEVRSALEEENIEARPVWKPMHLQPVFDPQITQIDADYRGRKKYPCRMVGGGVAEDLFERGLCLPSGTNMTEVDMGRIEEALMGIFGRRG